MNYELGIRNNCKVKRIFKSVIPYSLFLLLAWRVVPVLAQVSPNVEGLALAAIDPRIIVAKIIRVVLGFLGIVVLVLITYGGFMWMTAAGNEERIDKAKKILTSAIIGLAVVLSSLAITQFVISRLIAASNNPNQYEIALYGGGGSGLAGQAFTVESIQPQGQLDSKKIIVKIAFSDAVDPDSDSLNARTIKVSRVDNGNVVEGNLAVGPIMMAGTRLNFSDRVVTFIPQTPCVEATNYFCFAENTEFKIEVFPGGVKRLRDQATVSCGLDASAVCQSSFTSGTIVDLTPPTVEFRRSPSSVALDGVVELQALVADNSGVALAEFFTEQKCPDQSVGAVLLEAIGPTGDTPKNVNLTAQWVPEDSQVAAPSEHELFAKAYDVDSGQTESSRLNVVVRPIHCSNGLLDSALGETGIDCGGATTACGGSTCGSCPNGPCDKDTDCADAMVCKEDTHTCGKGPPEISGISPGDGKVGTLVSIVGLNFGSTAGKVYFTGASGEIEASAPSQCQNITPWQDQLVMVNVPAGAQDGPARLVTAAGIADSSNDGNGLVVPVRYLPAPRPAGVPADGFFDVNELTRPALCSATSPPQNLPAGRTGTIVNLAGAQFGNQCVDQSCGGVFFGGVPGQGLANWTDTGAQSAVPRISYGQVGISYGEVRIQMINAQGLASNNLPYKVLSLDDGTTPRIERIACAPQGESSTGPGTGCTISGQNFGATPGLVQFVAPDEQVVSADTSVPSQCAQSWWTANSITIKVPRVVDLSDVDDDNNRSELLTSALASGAYKIFVRRYDAVDSNKINFTMTDTQGPYLACIVPSSGPTFTNVTAYGERLGSAVAQGRGLLFSNSNISSASATGWTSVLATLVNIGGVQGDSCPALGWSTEKACAQVPGTARSGDVIVENDIDGLTQQSNPVDFQVGNCNEPASGISCGTLTCCADGTCNMQCSSSTIPVAAYGWSFSTAVAPVVPTVRVFCDAQSASPAEPPSPAPWDRTMGNNVCVNSIVSVGFSTRIENSAASLVDPIAPGFKIDKCLGAENLLNSRNADFEIDTGDYLWTPVDARYLTGAVVGNVGRDSNKALLLEKRDNDTGPGWNGRNYEHWFGYGTPIISNTNGTTYTASAWMRLNPSSAIQNKKAGILIQRDGSQGVGNTCGGVYPGQTCTTDANCAAMTTPSYRFCLPTPELWMKSSQEIELSTEEWRQVTTTITFDRQGPNSGAPAYARLFLEGDRYDQDENSAEARGDFSVYVDDIQVTADPCLRTEPVLLNAEGSRLEIVQTSIDPETGLHREGFRFSPAAPWSTNSWYRVTLLNTIRGEGEFGQAMQIANDPTPCGYATAAYCFRFKTRNTTDPCAVGAIAVSPNPWTALARNEKINYSALPLAAGDHCVALNQNLPNWQWFSSAPLKAQVEFALGHIGHICKTDADCEVGSCLPATAITKFCTSMGWTTTATAFQETDINAQGQPVPARIQARVPDVSGSADLFVQFESPRITQWWPNCGAACTNAEIGGQFNVVMDSSTIAASNIELWKMDCGNGRVDTGEDCDDGNVRPGDGCSARCTREGADFNWQCGDNTIDAGEDCDGGNVVAGDGCSAICLNEGVAVGQWSLTGASGTCDNNIREWNQTTGLGEECDDGNSADGDGCSSRCLREGTRSSVSICGNGRLESGEECERISIDDQSRPVFDNQVCSAATCLRKGRSAPLCGNGLVDPGEECDRTFDDNWPPNNLCGQVSTAGGTSTQCLWSGTQRPTVQGGAGCGNGRIDLGEDCDDGNVRSGDGCSATCLNQGSQAISVPACGNNIPERGAGEDCDDGNMENGDGCSSRCLNEGTTSVTCGNSIKENIAEDCDWALIAQSPSFTTAQAQALCHPTLCTNLGSTTTCGNGVLETGEDCDDDNVVADDGCSARCLNEGTTASKVTITPEYNSVERAFGLGILNLAQNTSYRVLVRGPGLLSVVGKSLQELNFFYDGWGNANQPPPSELDRSRTPNAFSWTFRTSGVMCNIERVELNPQRASLYVIGSRQSYSAAPYGPPDSCAPQGQRLNALDYRWSWSTENNNVVASIANAPGVNIIPSCGNGRIEPGEDCDDNNILSGDGCSGTDALEKCTFEGAGFAKACGNERIDLGEECDWPVFCSPKCLLTGTPPCASASDNGICCGNGVQDIIAQGATATDEDIFVEDCDDGNLMAGDGCSPQCLSETKTLLSGTMPKAVCNNGRVEYGEECEDGNLTAGDGCSDKCLLEGVGQNHGTIAEAGPATGAVLPEAPPRIDPYQQAEARGIQKFCRNTSGTFTTTSCVLSCTETGQLCLPPNPWSTTQVNATARLKTGSAQLTVFCSARTDRDCPVPADSVDSGFGDPEIGRGSDGCCYSRPTVADHGPSGTDVCPNAVFRAVFNTLLDPTSLQGKVRLARVRNGACLAGETDLNTGAAYWCAPADTRLGVSLETSTLAQEDIDPNEHDLVSVLVMRPSKMLAVNTASVSAEYKILLYGDDNINDQTTAGIKSLTGAAMNGLYSAWDIQTASAPCRLDHVVLEVTPANTNFNTSGEQRSVRAMAQDNRNAEIESVQGYAWQWSWGSADTEIVSVTTGAGQSQTVTAGSKNGTAAINATATITEDTIFTPSTAGEVGDCGTDSRCTDDPGRTCEADSDCAVPAVRKTGAKDFTVFICDNPWPIDPATGAFTPFIDVGVGDIRHNPAITLTGRSPMNFATYYCRDGETVLPKLSYPGAVLLASSLFPDTARPYRMASVGETPTKLKEFLLTTSTFTSTGEVDLVSGKDIIVDRSSAGVETDTLAGSASAYDNADFVYNFELPDNGDYELELETSNFSEPPNSSDDLSNLASILDEENISDDLREILSEDENEYFKLSGAWYHELEVYIDGILQGNVVNRASGPNRHMRGTIILRSLDRGSHTVLLRWVNDNRLPSRTIEGHQAGSIWDSNLRIYSLRVKTGRAEDQAIGIRVMSNPGRRSLRSWYDVMGFQGTPVPYTDGVGGYEALQDGNTIYVSAINTRGSEDSTNQTVFGNVYIISLSEGAKPALQTIYNQIVANLSFNVNLENLRTCAADFCSQNNSRVFVSGDANCGDSVQKVCSNDLDCSVAGQISCQADKDKLKRDLIRLGQLTSVRDALSAYNAGGTRGYPTLEAGTYIRGMSTSRWPSWNATLGAALGIPLPQDPINLYAAGCLPVGSETGTYDQTTCWNETSQTYRCPYGSRIYQYESQGGLGYKFSAELELLERDLDNDGDIDWNVDGWEPLASGNRIISVGGVCSWRAPGDIQWSNAEARCGNRVIETGACRNGFCSNFPTRACETNSSCQETCELGSSEQGTVTLAPAARRCTGNPDITCSTDDPCPTGAGNCEPLTSCVAVRSCRSDCTGWQNWSSGTVASAPPVVADCAAGGTFCGNGVVEGEETCDDGLLNGDYGKCNDSCTGFGERCGDGITNGPEICDDGDNNGGSYNGLEDSPDFYRGWGRWRGWCKFDCTGFGPRCGDTEKQEPYEQCDPSDPASNTRTSDKYCVGGTRDGQPCANNSECGEDVVCGYCPRGQATQQNSASGYPLILRQTCGILCSWPRMWGCVPQGGCGNGGRPEGNEQCDDGNRNNTDACTNQCETARCGDGFIRQDITAEECDAGAQNGVLCDSRYEGTCTYCDRQCNIGTLSGGFCGDRVAQPAYEQCDGLAGLNNWMCQGSIGATEKFWHFNNLNNWIAMTDICDDSGCRASTTISQWPGGYHSQSALRLVHEAVANAAGRSGAKFINAVPSTNGTSYTVSAFVNTVDANAYGRKALIALRRTGTTIEDNAQVVLDDDPQTWQYLERTVNFNADPSERPGEIQLFVQPAYTYTVLFDQVHVLPDTDIGDTSPENLSCQQANCRGACVTGAVCENVGDNSDRQGVLYGEETCMGEGSSGMCLSRTYRNYDLNHPVPLSWDQLISDSIVDSCDNDQDNDGDPHGSDCDDHDPTRHHDAIEICGNGIDDNCDGRIDECASVTIGVVDNGSSDDTFCIYLDDRLVNYAYGHTERTVDISALAPGFHQLKVLFHHQDGFGSRGTYRVNFSSNIRVLNSIDLTGILRNPAQRFDAVETGDAEDVCSETNGTRNVGMADAGSATYMIEVGSGSGGEGGGGGAGAVSCRTNAECPTDRPVCDTTSSTCVYLGP